MHLYCPGGAPPGRSEWYSSSRQQNQAISAWIIGVSKCAHIQLTIVAVNRCSYRSVIGLINQSTTREVEPSGENGNEYNSCFSLTSLRLPRRASPTTRRRPESAEPKRNYWPLRRCWTGPSLCTGTKQILLRLIESC